MGGYPRIIQKPASCIKTKIETNGFGDSLFQETPIAIIWFHVAVNWKNHSGPLIYQCCMLPS